MRSTRLRLILCLLCGLVLTGGIVEAQLELRGSKGSKKPLGAADLPPPDDLTRPPADARSLESGVVMKRLDSSVVGEPAGVNDMIDLHYTGWSATGELFDTTVHRQRPRRVRINQLMEGLAAALIHMAEGEKQRVWIPAALTALPSNPEPPRHDMVFDLELVRIFRAPPTPEDVAAVPDTAIRTDSGLAYRILKDGDGGRHPGDAAMVYVDYTSWRTDGVLYDSSVLVSRPINFRLDETIPAFAEAVPQMTRGSKWRMWVPQELANLDDKQDIDQMLVFDFELLEFLDPPETPADVGGVPADAIVDEMGLAHKVLRPGTGTRHPDYDDTVKLVYAGWTLDGKLFDSAYSHGRAATMPMDSGRPIGWTESLRNMVVGEKRRIWIPGELAYGDREDRPQGMLVFEVELLSIED